MTADDDRIHTIVRELRRYANGDPVYRTGPDVVNHDRDVVLALTDAVLILARRVETLEERLRKHSHPGLTRYR